MKPLFSEFTYGYAVVDELSRLGQLSALPIFPTLVQEGKLGYDVEVNISGMPLFLQFKRSDYLIGRSSRQYSFFTSHITDFIYIP